MSRSYFTNAACGAVGAAAFTAILTLCVNAALAESSTTVPNIHVDGRYHSVTNGIPDYDGFDRFRDPNGNPLPGWEQVLRSPG